MSIKYLIPLAVASLAITSTPAAAAVKVFDFSGTLNNRSVTGYFSYDTDASPSGGQVFPDGSVQEFYTTDVNLHINGFSYSRVYVNYIHQYYDKMTDYFSLNGYADDIGGDAIGNANGSGVTFTTKLPSRPAGSLPTDLAGKVFSGPSGSVTVNVPGGVPEPATWAMMIAGFGLVGGTLRRRQGRALAAA